MDPALLELHEGGGIANEFVGPAPEHASDKILVFGGHVRPSTGGSAPKPNLLCRTRLGSRPGFTPSVVGDVEAGSSDVTPGAVHPAWLHVLASLWKTNASRPGLGDRLRACDGKRTHPSRFGRRFTFV